MNKRQRLCSIAGVAALLGGVAAYGLEVKLQVTETAQAARTGTPVTTGVPFSKGAVTDLSKLAVKAGGKALPASFLKTVAWDDGSVRWALMDVQVDVPAGGKTELALSDAGGNAAPAAPLKIEDTADSVKVNTGPMQFTVSKKKGGLFDSIQVDGKELLTGAGKGLVVYKDGGGEVAAAAPAEVTLEQAGPLRAIVCVKGVFPGLHMDLLGYTARITAYSGKKYVKVHFWLENRGGFGYYRSKSGEDEPHNAINMDWFYFRGMAVDLGLGLGETVTATCEGVQSPGHLKVVQVCKESKTQEKVQYKRAPLYTFNDLEYTVGSGTNVLKRGDRTDGVVGLKGDQGAATVMIRDFWQNYEKAIELDGKSLKLWLWPTEGQYPRHAGKAGYFDKRIEECQKDGGYYLEGAVHKGHEFMLDFSGRDPKETAADLAQPLMALAPAEYYASTEAAPGLFAPPDVRTGDRDCDFKLDAWVRSTRSAADPANPTSLYKARETVGNDTLYWFGWMDFGDICLPGHGFTSLSYDWPWSMLVNVMRTGDMNFMRLATDMAHHRIDVDTLWSDQDLPEIRGMLRNSGFIQFHCGRLRWVPGAGDNGLPGLVLFYMLTGEPKALECARRGGEGLKASWQWVAEAKPYGGPQGDMAANGFSMQCFVAMYDLTADRKWLDEALKLFNDHVVPTWKSVGPHLHDAMNQIRSQDYVQEDYKYYCAIQGLCELARVVNDDKLMEMLKAGADKPLPTTTSFEAPFFFSGQLGFMAYATTNQDYLAKAMDSFVQGFPESKSPPIFLPNNSVWSQTSAMMLRTGHLLQYAAWKMKKKE